MTAAVVAICLALSGPACAQSQARAQPCPDQNYGLSGEVLGRTGVTLTVQGRTIGLEGMCDARRGAVKATKKGTRLQLRWPQCGDDRNVRLQARIDPSCESVNATVRARGRGRSSKVSGNRQVVPPPTTVPTTTVPTTTGPSRTTTTTTTPTTTTTTLPPSCTEAVMRQAIEAGGDVVLECPGQIVPITQAFEVPAGRAVRLTTAGSQPAVLDGGGVTRLFVVGGALTLENLVVQRFGATAPAGPIGVAASDGADGPNAPATPAGGHGGNGQPAGMAVDGGVGEPGRGGAIVVAPGGMMRADGVVFRGNMVRGGDGGAGGSCNGLPTGQECGNGGSAGNGSAGASVTSGAGGPGGAGGKGGAALTSSGGGPAASGEGGAIYNAGELWVVDSVFDGNQASGGVGGFGDIGGSGGNGGAGGRGGRGTTGGAGGSGGDGGYGGLGGKGGAGGVAQGAAIFNAAGAILSVEQTTFTANLATGGAGGDGGAGGTCGDAGAGGDPGTATSGTDIGGKGGRGGNGGAGGNAGRGGDAVGGAIYNAGTLNLETVSVGFARNAVQPGGAGKTGSGAPGCPAGRAGDQGMGGTPGTNGSPGQGATVGTATGPNVLSVP